MDGTSVHAGRVPTIEPPDDGAAYSARTSPHTWATGPEVVASVLYAAELRGVKVRTADGRLDGRALKRANHVATLYDLGRRRSAAAPASGGTLVLSKGQAATDLYPDCRGDRAAQLRKKRCVARWAEELYDVELWLRVGTHQTANGQDAGIIIQMLPVPANAAALAELYGLTRRAETRTQRRERRVRPFCRRAGQPSTNRYLTPAQGASVPGRAFCVPDPRDPFRGVRGGAASTGSLSFPQTIGPPWACPAPETPKGVPGPGQAERTTTGLAFSDIAHGDARESGARDEASRARQAIRAALDTPGSTGHDGGSAGAIDVRVSELAREMARKRLLAARLTPRTYPTYGEISSVVRLTVGEGLLHAHGRRRGELERAARRFDRYALRLADAGHPTPAPTALAWLLLDAERLPEHVLVESVGYFAHRLEQASRQLRARWRELNPDDTPARRRRRERRVKRRREGNGGHLGAWRTAEPRPDMIVWGAQHTTGLEPADVDRQLAELERQAAETTDALDV